MTDPLRIPGGGRGSLINVDSENFQALCEEVLDLRQKATQRGARLEVMWEWMQTNNLPAWSLFCRDHPESHDWFDEHGVPK